MDDIRPIGSAAPPRPPVKTERSLPGAGQAPVPVKPAAAPAVAVAAVQQPDAVPSTAQLSQAVQAVNKAMQDLSQNLEFSVDEDSNRTIVKIVDKETKEIIRQLPSKEMLEIARALDKVQGLLIRQKA